MGKNIVQKIFGSHLDSGKLETDQPISVNIDQVLTQDATGTMAFLQFEAMGLPKIKTELAVSYIDHNMLQTSFRNPDDHKYLQTAAAKYGAYYSRPGNGICHQVHLERFGVPGKILLGSDSHTPTGGGLGMISIGVGGIDIATTMAGNPFELNMPKVVKVNLTGELNRPWVASMDIILEMLRRLTVKGGVGKIFEYSGPGVASLTLPERATITNMGAELGATTSLFPSDDRTKYFLEAQGRGDDWHELKADPDAEYDEEMEINLDELRPLIAKPSSPDNVVPVKEIEGLKVDQVCVGSCTNSSYQVMSGIGELLKDKVIAPNLSMTVTPGTKQVYEMMADNGDLASMIKAGVRILESACGPCIGMGQAPPSGGVSIRSFNRNFKGRSGTMDAQVYLCNPFVATAIALEGKVFDPADTGMKFEERPESKQFIVNDNFLIPPPEDSSDVEVLRGPNIKPIPINEPLNDTIEAPVVLKTEDNISTDDILPAGSEILPLRSNIPAISEFVYHRLDETFAKRAKELGKSVIIGGNNYGQGSSREHAAMAPMYLGVKAVIVKNFARIHRANLINFGVLPLEFDYTDDYDKINQDDTLKISGVRSAVDNGGRFILENERTNEKYPVHGDFSERQKKVLLAGGLLPYIKSQSK
ncbi:aconitate hydratase [candidate division KSB1 bacterium]|nr:aconitate hydratase [candidate division KSB1 bacterium]